MKCAIMQPTFDPWLGLFDMIDKVDRFVVYDDVQLTKRSWQVRNKILTTNGELFLTIPIKKTDNRDDVLINQAQIEYGNSWQQQHLKSIKYSYSKARYFDEVFSFITNIYGQNIALLSDFNYTIIKGICDRIGIVTLMMKSSELNNIQGAKDLRLVNVCRAIGSDSYLSAAGSACYIEQSTPGGVFPENNINLEYHKYNHPTYNQCFKGDFVAYIGIFDLLFNEGFADSLDVIRSGRDEDYPYMTYRTLLNK